MQRRNGEGAKQDPRANERLRNNARNILSNVPPLPQPKVGERDIYNLTKISEEKVQENKLRSNLQKILRKGLGLEQPDKNNPHNSVTLPTSE